FFDREDPQQVWDTWFQQFFTHIEENKDVVRAVSYINANWEGQDMWKGEKWGQTRLETAPLLKSKWLEKMAEAQFVNAVDKPFDLIGFPNSKARSPDSGTYRDASLAVGKRVEDLLRRMTLQEKVAQLTGWWNPNEEQLRREGRIHDPAFYAEKCPHGIGQLGPLHNLTVEEDLKQYAAVQEYFRNRTRLGIPAIQHDEAAHGFMRFEANSFPSPIGLSCSWNPDLMERIYDQAGREARSRGVSPILSPILDVSRDLRWGRVDETLGEDPFLIAKLGEAMVRGLQGSSDGSIDSDHVAATLKHFAGYGSTEGGRNRSPYPFGPRHLLDHDVAAFRTVIRNAQPAAVMAAFNEFEGLPCHVNP
ncbi:MAG: glycoside hydrolase family 3 N-terminal domain-containing protein, partial [Verrucomicrobiota bacterium]|nr:glycoside hydrolase family 3 N-terminal domain-containing protein [Verrucomicrobiota bacterium]